jgi:hypothetical protein
LTGDVRGTVVVLHEVPDVGDMWVLGGRGQVGSLGRVSVHGVVQWSFATGRPTGTLILANRYGRVDLRLDANPRPAPDGDGHTFQFVVTSATGEYAEFRGNGGVFELIVRAYGPANVGMFQIRINPVSIASQ